MPRPLSGTVIERRLSDGRLAFDVKIRGRQVLVGVEPEWDRARVDRLLDNELIPAAKLKHPWWDRIPDRAKTHMRGVAPDFIVAAADYLHRLGRYQNGNTANASRSPVVKHLLPFFAYEDAARERPRKVDTITGRMVDEFTMTKMEEREVLRDLADTLAELDDATLRDEDALRAQLDPREWELLGRYGQRSAKGKWSLSSRGASNNYINACLKRLREIIVMVNDDYDLAIKNPTKGRTVTKTEPPRTWLRPNHLEAIFHAATELDAHPPRQDWGNQGRFAAVVTLGLAGLRVGEFGHVRYRDVLFGEGVLHIPDAKTSAGERDIEMHALVQTALRARREFTGGDDNDLVWPTARGNVRDRNNVRNRLLAPVLTRASELLKERDQRPLPERLTPHTFRRTYLTYLAWAERPMRFAMSQAGHKDGQLTLEVYQQPFPSEIDPRVPVWLG